MQLKDRRILERMTGRSYCIVECFVQLPEVLNPVRGYLEMAMIRNLLEPFEVLDWAEEDHQKNGSSFGMMEHPIEKIHYYTVIAPGTLQCEEQLVFVLIRHWRYLKIWWNIFSFWEHSSILHHYRFSVLRLLDHTVFVHYGNVTLRRDHCVLQHILSSHPVACCGPGDIDPSTKEVASHSDICALAVHQGELGRGQVF